MDEHDRAHEICDLLVAVANRNKRYEVRALFVVSVGYDGTVEIRAAGDRDAADAAARVLLIDRTDGAA